MTALVLGGVLAASVRGQQALDDPDPARQRPGILDFGSLPERAPPLTPALPVDGRRTVVFFERTAAHAAQLCAAASAFEGQNVDMVVVAPDRAPATCSAPLVVVRDDGDLARRYGLPRPRDGGLPVGYAIVDSAGWIRYRTLDPAVLDELYEVSVMLSDTP